jgi:2'-5' RNA ligase
MVPADRSGPRVTVRCFLAVDPSSEVRAALAGRLADLAAGARRADVRWVDAAALHLTIKFLGQVAVDGVEAIPAALAGALRDTPPLQLAAGGFGAFPSPRRARVVWAGITDGTAALARLAAQVDEALAPLGFPAEGRSFHGHLTLGRVRSPRGLGPLAREIERAEGLGFGAWTAREVVLYRSRLGRGGAVYEPLARLALGAGDT